MYQRVGGLNDGTSKIPTNVKLTVATEINAALDLIDHGTTAHCFLGKKEKTDQTHRYSMISRGRCITCVARSYKAQAPRVGLLRIGVVSQCSRSGSRCSRMGKVDSV